MVVAFSFGPKLQLGMSDAVCVFQDYVALRSAMITVPGHKSEHFSTSKQVFHSTALGRALWNIFFELIDAAILREACWGSKTADDLSAYEPSEASNSN